MDLLTCCFPSSTVVEIKDDKQKEKTQSKFSGPFWLAMNIISSVGLIISNKWVFSQSNFKFSTTLTFFHQLTTMAVLHACLIFGLFEKKLLPWLEVSKLAFWSGMGIIFMNLNLYFNTVGVYQLSKLLIIPLTVFIQWMFYNTTFTYKTLISLVIITIGVGVATLSTLSFTSIGTLFAAIAVFSQTMSQILIQSKQKELQASPSQLVYYQTPLVALLTIPLIPAFDNVSIDDPNSLWYFEMSKGLLSGLVLSCILAGMLNISGFYVIGVFSPITYQVTGHFKTMMILSLGFVVFGDRLEFDVGLGLVLAMVGLIMYSAEK